MRDLKKELLSNFGEKLAAFGFEKKAKQQSFFRPIEGGRAYVHLSFINHADDFDVTIDVAIRFDEVENLINSKNNFLTQKQKKLTCTLGVELGNLSIGEQKRWSVSSEGQVSLIADALLEYFERFGNPYLLKYSSMVSAYELLSSDERSVWIHSPFHSDRAKRAIAIAKLLGHSDIQSQISIRKKFLEEIKDCGLSDFLSFANSFCNNAPL